MKIRFAVLVCLHVPSFAACTEDSDKTDIPAPRQQESSPVAPRPDVVADCDEAENGTPCGDPGRGMHCLFDACVRNACGDGIAAEAEECDDGNERDGDGCSERCKLERCGNGLVNLGEECDDANAMTGDGCSLRCKRERCGNRVIDPGEECDDGNSRDDDLCSNRCKAQMPAVPDTMQPMDSGTGHAGDAGASDASVSMDAGSSADAGGADASGGEAGLDAAEAGSNDASRDGSSTEGGTSDAAPDANNAWDGSDPRSPQCIACVQEMGENPSPCRNFEGSGFDLVANCADNPDPSFAQRCVDAYLCSLHAPDHCADDLTRGPVSCYCGLDRTIDQCNATSGAVFGPAGACIPQWEAATGCSAGDNLCVNSRFVDITQPAGVASALITCTVSSDYCGTDCRP